MPFVARVNSPKHSPPYRAYIHSALGEAIYAPKGSGIELVAMNACNYLTKVLAAHGDVLREVDYVLAALWGYDSDRGPHRVADLFCFSDVGSNPDSRVMIVDNGAIVPAWHPRAMTCGDTLILIGAEERYRRRAGLLEGYIERGPPIHELSDVVSDLAEFNLEH